MSQDLYKLYEKEPAYSWQSKQVILAGCPQCGATFEVLAPKRRKDRYTLHLQPWHYQCSTCKVPLE